MEQYERTVEKSNPSAILLYIQTYLALVLFINRACIVSTAFQKTEVVKEINKQLVEFKLSMDHLWTSI